eukprot:Phypoly_transcript_01851.p1 GENE.Phypoly_transcript_01851~~Phypoly_transcript_01851.p1  ORF type:complete len:876 (+),score=128.73 Phypoly_transcript_01851:473-3100(+)
MSLKQHLISTFRIAVAINLSLSSGDISLKSLHRQNLDEVIKLVVGAIRKLCYGVKRDPGAPVSMSDPIQMVKNAVIQLRNWVDQFSDGSSSDIVNKPEWKRAFVDKKADLVEALTSLQLILTHSAFDLNIEVLDLNALMKRSIILGDALARNPLNAQCRKQVENIVFEGIDLVRRILPYLRREFSGVPENPSGALTYAEPIVTKDTEIPEPVIDEADAGEEDPPSLRVEFYDRLNLRVRSGSEPSVSTTPPLEDQGPTTVITATNPPSIPSAPPGSTSSSKPPAASSAPLSSPLATHSRPPSTHMPVPVPTTHSSASAPSSPALSVSPALGSSAPSSSALGRKQSKEKDSKSTSATSIFKFMKGSSNNQLPVQRFESLKKKPHSAVELFRREPKNPTPAVEEEQPPGPMTVEVPPTIVFNPPSETPYTPPPLRYAFSEKKQKPQEEVEDLSLDSLDPAPSFDDILGMLQDDSRQVSSKDLFALEEGASSLQLASANSSDSPREGELKVTTALSSYASVDLPQVLPSKEYIIEKIGKDSKRYTSNFAISLETPENYFGYYSEHFYGNEHWNYVGNVRDLGGAVAISITKFVDPNSRKYMAVICTRTGDTRLLLQAKSPKLKDLYASLLRAIAPAAVKSKNLLLVKDPAIHNSLLKFEKSQLLTCFKIAVLYVGPHQTKEDEFYGNTKHSPDFEEFLNFLGDRVELKGWQGFRAGLDVKTNTTGTHSVFTKFMELSIMFHVSTFLPYNPLDEQQVERKRHLGNDIVMIVFQEGDQPFSPDAITSEFNQVFFVVRKIATEDGSTSYQLSVVAHDMISPFGPMVPDPPIFKKSAFFRRWLLTKLINSEAAAYAAPAIALKLNRARGELLDIIYKEFCHK